MPVQMGIQNSLCSWDCPCPHVPTYIVVSTIPKLISFVMFAEINKIHTQAVKMTWVLFVIQSILIIISRELP